HGVRVPIAHHAAEFLQRPALLMLQVGCHLGLRATHQFPHCLYSFAVPVEGYGRDAVAHRTAHDPGVRWVWLEHVVLEIKRNPLASLYELPDFPGCFVMVGDDTQLGFVVGYLLPGSA